MRRDLRFRYDSDKVWRIHSREPPAPLFKYQDFASAFDVPGSSGEENQAKAQEGLFALLAVDPHADGNFTCSSPIIEMALSDATNATLNALIANETKSEEEGYPHGYSLTEEQAGRVRATIRQINATYSSPAEGDDEESDSGGWGHFTLTLFNLLVGVSVLADYSITGLYLAILYAAGGVLRPVCLFGSWKGWIYESTRVGKIIGLVRACYMGRHERDFKLEEETYRMLQEIMRSPELFKALTGSCLRGAADPLLDHASPETKEKLA